MCNLNILKSINTRLLLNLKLGSATLKECREDGEETI
jgi:hypothetical protein